MFSLNGGFAKVIEKYCVISTKCCIFEDNQQKFSRNLVSRFISEKVEITMKKCE